MRKYGIIPMASQRAAQTVFDVITVPSSAIFVVKNVKSGTITDRNGQTQDDVTVSFNTKIVEAANWTRTQQDFVEDAWTDYFASHSEAVDDFIQISTTGRDLGNKI